MAISSSWIIIGALIWLVAMVVLYFAAGDEESAMPDGKSSGSKSQAKDVSTYHSSSSD